MKHRQQWICGRIVFSLAQALFLPGLAHAQALEFDLAILKSRGLDTSLGQYFADSAKFMPGRKSVVLSVNGQEKGTVMAFFGKKGELCVDEAFLQNAGLKVPSDLPVGKAEDMACHDYRNDYPSAVVTPKPGEESLLLVVPQDALATDDSLAERINHGGSAALVNYSVMSSQSRYSGGASRYDQLTLEDGVNMHDWLLRSRQIMTQMDNTRSQELLYTYVQHTFEHTKKIMQAGQINISSALVSGAAINGIQFVPESALSDKNGEGITVTGMANSAQARVEVKQFGRVVFSTLVPAGPFTLDNVPVTSLSSAIEVSVIEIDGSSSHYTVSADALRGRMIAPQGLSFALGQSQDQAEDGRQPWLASVTDGWNLTTWLNVSAGGMLAEAYRSVATQFEFAPYSDLSLDATLRGSQDVLHDYAGQSINVNVNATMTKALALTLSATRYTPGYREFSDTLDDDFTQYNGQYSGSLSWGTALLGSFSFSYSLSEGSDGESDSRYLSASWGRTLFGVSLSLNWQHLLSQATNEGVGNPNAGDMLFFTLSVPLGSQSLSTYAHKSGQELRSGLGTSGNIGRENSYSLAMERSSGNGERNINGSLNSNLHYTQLAVGAGKDGTSGTNRSFTFSGGVVAHHSGLTFSPYTVQETFGIASVGQSVGGVEIMTPDGAIWTDRWGKAVVPSLPAYKAARIEMNTDSLPKNVDVSNGINMVSAGHGSVSEMDFSILSVRRVMLTVVMQKTHRPLPKNATLVDDDGNYVTTVVDNGQVYLNDAEHIHGLHLIDDDGKIQCTLQYALAKEHDAHSIYEEAQGMCL
jgi:outer membrane usher protein FimD/PapC